MKICGVCGTSFAQILKSQFIGCPECYHVFEKEIKESLKANGFEGNYQGSLPKKLKGYKSILVNRVEMQLKLEEAVEAEEYEKAALYRDYLKVLNGHVIQNGEDEIEN